MKRVTGALLALIVLFLLFWADETNNLDTHHSQAANQWDLIESVATPSPSPESEAVISAVSERLAVEFVHMPVLQLASTTIEEVQISEDQRWASALLVPSDPQTGETLPSEPGLAILQRSELGWQVYLPTDNGWLDALLQAPPNLISTEQKAAWEEVHASTLDEAPDIPFTGYLLPWAGGLTRSLSQSINHDLYTPSGSAHYAFDFYTSGQMWSIYAAKSGTVWSWRDDVPTCLEFTCSSAQPYGNFIVLQDTSTTPTSYQLYLHLAQNSIPAQLKQIGTPVLQGQFIGTADNTGQSWGHHLHFQVHTNPSSYWGYSVDIVFADVFINGGRPRTAVEAQEGEVGQRDYRSLNYVQDDHIAPLGGLLDPMQNGFDILDGQLQLAAWAIDQQSGVARAQIEAYYNDQWQPVGPQFTGPQMTYDWDLCASQVPVGPLSLRLVITDYGGNSTPSNFSLRHGLNNTRCQSPPVNCVPADNQVALFSEPDFSGACVVFASGSFPDLGHVQNFDLDRIGSIQVGTQATATLYSELDYKGRRETFAFSDAGFSDNLMHRGQVSSLLVVEKQSPPAMPDLQQPAPNTQITDESLLFYWLGGVNSTRYQVRVLSDGTVTRTHQLSQPFWQLLDLPTGEYQWQVQSSNTASATSDWSALNSFTIGADQPATTPYTATYSTTFEVIDPDWVWTGDWQISSDDQHFRSPPQAFVFEPETLEQPAHGSLTSPEIYLPVDNLVLGFYYRYQGESGLIWDQRRVQVSADGGPFQDVLQLSDDPAGIWLHSPMIDLSDYTGQKIRVRFTISSLDPFANAPLSWEIDDFEIAPAAAVACPSEPDAGETSDQSLAIAIGSQVSGTLCPAGDRDLYSLDITQPGTTLLISMAAAQLGSPLDTYLSLYDSDGKSLLAANDDAIPYILTDSRLGYTFSRPGRYYLMVKAWDHPQAGSVDHHYLLQVSESLAGEFYFPPTGSTLGSGTTTLQVLAQDNGGLVKSVSFYWHSGDWANDGWQLLGRDEDGRDGWQTTFDGTGLPDQRSMAFYALIEDRAGRQHATAVWDIVLQTGKNIFLPIVTR